MSDSPLVQDRSANPFSFYNWTRSLFSGPSNIFRYKFRSSQDERISGLLFVSLQLFVFTVFNLGLNIPSIVFASKSMHSCVTTDTVGRPAYDSRLPTWLMISAITQIVCGSIVLLGYGVLYYPRRAQSYSLGSGRKISSAISAWIGLSSTFITALTFAGLILLFSNPGRICRQSKESLGGVAFGLSVASLIMGLYWIIDNTRTTYMKLRADLENEL